MSRSFPPRARLRAAADFQAAFKQGKRLSSPQLRLIVRLRSEPGEPRLGIAVSRKVDKRAVVRNRIKRLARELFRQERAGLPAGDYVLVAQPGAAAQPLSALREQLAGLLQRARSLKAPAAGGTMPPFPDASARPATNPPES
ncbi:ribonuclease P protein component [Arenimonas fontis]|uniref:Ribonuclease P protein component n=1 Tax=Arenimonas fontis TaxID=2608255 RepID=A0A5B2Z866_9GAMM|nr:ribonuclease P protein component [Arenimonas fontis]